MSDPTFPSSRPLQFSQLRFAAPLVAAVLAPHPDDFDAIAVTMRHLRDDGHRLEVAVLTTGASGVEDGFAGATSAKEKALVREQEQRASCHMFGLPEKSLAFLRLWNDGTSEEAADRAKLRDYLLRIRPDLVFLPHGNDANATHRRVYEHFRAIASEEGLRLWACLNLDAKTAAMRRDLYTYFGEEEAAWKAQLLRLHASQQARNLRTRGSGFDERVLALNRSAAANGPAPYAEVFELERYGN